MNKTEKHVSDHLEYRGFTNGVYEPDGNIPPDFSVNGTTAIEVRRLNQNHFDGSVTKGLEELAIPVWKGIENLVGSLGSPTDSESWFVIYRLTRPVETWKTLRPNCAERLRPYEL